MPRKIYKQTAFNAGELSPRLYSRVDIGKYDNGLKTGTNCYVVGHGPVIRRNGTKYIAEIETSAETVKLVKFQLNATTAYILEFGDEYIRFYDSTGQLQSCCSTYQITSPYDYTDLPSLTYVQEGTSLYLAHPDYAPRKLTRNGATDWTLETITFLPAPTYEAGYEPATTLTPAATTGTGVDFTAGASTFLDGDIGRQIINNADGETGRATITAVTSATVAVCTIIEDFTDTNAIASGDWKMDLSPIADLTPSGSKVGSIIDLDADLADSTTAVDTFRSADVGKYILLHNGVVQITSLTSASSIKAEVLKSLDSLDETANWTLEEETWDGTRGYPRAVGVFQDRLCFGGTVAQPQTLWLSETGIFDGFGVGTGDDDSIEVTLSASAPSEINWMAVGRNLILGTSNAEHTVDGGSTGASITPSSIRQEPRSYKGSEPQIPLVVGSEVIFIQASERKIRSFRYDFNIDGYQSEDLTFLAEHITAGVVKEIAYAQEPDSQVFAVLDDGTMVVGTYLREQEVIGWTTYTTDGSFENVQTITNGTVDEVWVVVKRTIDGSTVRYIEKFDTGDGTDRLDMFSDSALTYSDPKAISAITSANPGVVTTATHGYSNGDKIKLIGVGGMTELENTSFLVANKTSTTFELESLSNSSITNSTYKWTASGSGTDEYYVELTGGGDPSLSEPASVYEDNSLMTEGTVGSLSTGEWDYGDNDTLGYSTIYVRLADGADPDSKSTDFVEYALAEDTSSYTTYTSGGEAHKIVTTISGLSHLEGETVQVKADGATHPDKTVVSGAITLSRDSYEVVVGMPFTTTVTPLSLNHDIGMGSMRGQRLRHIRPILEVYKSTRPAVNGKTIPSRSSADEMDQAVDLDTGFLNYGNLGWTDTLSLTITTSDPLPLTLLGIFGSVDGGVR